MSRVEEVKPQYYQFERKFKVPRSELKVRGNYMLYTRVDSTRGNFTYIYDDTQPITAGHKRLSIYAKVGCTLVGINRPHPGVSEQLDAPIDLQFCHPTHPDPWEFEVNSEGLLARICKNELYDLFRETWDKYSVGARDVDRHSNRERDFILTEGFFVEDEYGAGAPVGYQAQTLTHGYPDDSSAGVREPRNPNAPLPAIGVTRGVE